MNLLFTKMLKSDDQSLIWINKKCCWW